MGDPLVRDNLATVVVVKYAPKNLQERKAVKEFEASLGSSLKRLGTIKETVRHANCCGGRGIRNPVLFCFNSCSKFSVIDYELLSVTFSLDELKTAAEARKMIVPIKHVPGIVPRSADRHWIFDKLRSLVTDAKQLSDRHMDVAKSHYIKSKDDMYDILDEDTGTPFTSAQLQMLTCELLNAKYRKLAKKHHNYVKLGKYIWNRKVYKEAFMLHSPVQASKLMREWSILNPPFTKIRNYLGEKIAFAQAWRDCWLRWGLVLPAILGIICILYGAIRVIMKNSKSSPSNKNDVESNTNDLMVLLNNTLVPYYALFMCLWTALYVVKWHSVSKTLQFEWGMTDYTVQDEHERPGYRGTALEDVFEHGKPSITTKERFKTLIRKLFSAAVISILVAMVIAMFILSLFVKFKLREVLDPEGSAGGTVKTYWILDAKLIAQMASGICNACGIITLRQIFNRVSFRLTVFENHIFETDFERSLTWKLFVMDFINTHFYNILVLFFRDIFERDGIFGISKEQCDLCMDDDCIAAVAINVFMILAMQGLVMPLLSWTWHQIQVWDRRKITDRHHQATESAELTPFTDTPVSQTLLNQIQKEFHFVTETLPGDTQAEYHRDYGTLMFMLKRMQLYSVAVMYTASCPIAPLLVICFEMFNHYRDRRKYTGRKYRRAAAQRAEGIGHWMSIQNVVNIIGIITNAAIIALQSEQGKSFLGIDWANYYDVTTSSRCDPCDELRKTKHIGRWILTVYLIIVFAVLTEVISMYFDVTPVHLKISLRRENYEVNKKLNQYEMENQP